MPKKQIELYELNSLNKKDYIEYILDYDADNLDNKIENQLLLDIVEKYVEISNELKNKMKEVERLSITDPLTNIFNRLKFNQAIELEFERYNRYKESFAIIMMDIDFFKKVNDNFGHQIGDETLIRFAEVISSELRSNDIFARWGGEEFIALIVESNLENANKLAERIRKKIEITLFKGVKHITVSMGVSAIHPNDTITELVKRADDGLYQSKESGRNKVTKVI